MAIQTYYMDGLLIDCIRLCDVIQRAESRSRRKEVEPEQETTTFELNYIEQQLKQLRERLPSLSDGYTEAAAKFDQAAQHAELLHDTPMSDDALKAMSRAADLMDSRQTTFINTLAKIRQYESKLRNALHCG